MLHCGLTTRFGSPIAIDRVGTVPSSFFELELFEAALLGKPSYIFLLKGFDPSPKLANLLKLLTPAFPGMTLEPLSEDAILKKIAGLVKHYERPPLLRLPLHAPRMKTFVDTLVRLRHRPYRVKDEPPPIRFVDGLFDPTVEPPNAAAVQLLLDRAEREPNYQNRLTWLWLAIRALMRAPYTDPKWRDFVPLWEATLGGWGSAGAWYGLHGHAAMGCLAAYGSLGEAHSAFSNAADRGIPHGPIASSYYSVARHAGHPRDFYDLALQHVEAALVVGPTNLANTVAIRGSIHLRLGNVAAALSDYEQVARLRAPLQDASYGEALSELGHGQFTAGRTREGLENLERGLDLLRRAPPSGFRIRAARKLAVACARSMKPLAALDLAVEAYDTAQSIGAMDQVSRLERIAKRIDRIRPHRFRR